MGENRRASARPRPPGQANPRAGKAAPRKEKEVSDGHPRDPGVLASPLSHASGGPRARMRTGEAASRAQEPHHERALLHRAFPALSGHAWGHDPRPPLPSAAPNVGPPHD